MKTAGTDNRARLVEAAEKTAYQRGFGNSSLADIAKAARMPVGNVYYYFKTKDQIGTAIVESRLSRFRRLLREFDRNPSPKERLCAFVDVKIRNREALARSGCPVGTFSSELHKQGGRVARRSTELLATALDWMEAQFRQIGKGKRSRGLAIHLLSGTQGVSLLGHVFHDPQMIVAECARLKQWIREL